MSDDNTSLVDEKKKKNQDPREPYNQNINARGPKWDASRVTAILKLHWEFSFAADQHCNVIPSFLSAWDGGPVASIINVEVPLVFWKWTSHVIKIRRVNTGKAVSDIDSCVYSKAHLSLGKDYQAKPCAFFSINGDRLRNSARLL